ncbi:Calcineurin-binding protein 1 [Linum grandiflorum]
MFSFAAINDTDSTHQWEPLAPTKEAQESHLTQTYHDGLLQLQAKQYDKARQLLESVLKDPLISNAHEVDGNASDSHMQQLRFLALKNLATVFLQQGSAHYKSALQCYLQAVEIDTKDSVVWNQLGTLSCSMGLLSISRWAFEQGLLCSPNNWTCMEKLLEVLIAIGDEVSCLAVAELLLRHWPSHSRALHVKCTIEDSDPVPFAPRGIDKLEPKHVRLKFLDKRKNTEENVDEVLARKRLKQTIELSLLGVSWGALVDALLEILLPLSGCDTEFGPDKLKKSGDVRLSIKLPSNLDTNMGSPERKRLIDFNHNQCMSLSNSNSEKDGSVKDREMNSLDEQPHERRSTRLERLRSRKPGKEEMDYGGSKDLVNVVLQYLEPFIVSTSLGENSEREVTCSALHTDNAKSPDKELKDISLFVMETCKNYGAYHISHLLIEHISTGDLMCPDEYPKLLELERLTRSWGKDRTPECSLFLAEVYYDLAFFPSNALKLSDFLSEASYHLCKIIESVALDYPFPLAHENAGGSWFHDKCSGDGNKTSSDHSRCLDLNSTDTLSSEKLNFWIRYYWLSGKLCILDGNKAKAYEEFSVSLSLVMKRDKMGDFSGKLRLCHLKGDSELTVDKILHEINLLKLDSLLEETVSELMENEKYVECINLLAPLLFSVENVFLDVFASPTKDDKNEEFTCIELKALDILAEASEKADPMDKEMYLMCHQRKLLIILVLAGMVEFKHSKQRSGSNALSAYDVVPKETPAKWNNLVAQEVKAISCSASKLKNFFDPSVNTNGTISSLSCISALQSLLVAVMCHFVINYLCKKSSVPVTADESEQKHECYLVDTCVAFCRLQHLVSTVAIKTQVELIVGIHDLLAEYGLCCAGEAGDEEGGTFLKFAIKHLLALDMKLRSNSSSSRVQPIHLDQQESPHGQGNTSDKGFKSDLMELDTGKLESRHINVGESGVSECSQSHESQKRATVKDCKKQQRNEDLEQADKPSEQNTECRNEMTEDEREELESMIDNALDQCFFCLYGLNLRSDSSYDEDLATHKNTTRGDYQTKEQCVDVFQYILPSAKASSCLSPLLQKTGLVKLRRVLRAIRKQFPQPPQDLLDGNVIDKFLDDPELCEDRLSDEAGSDGYLETVMKFLLPDVGNVKQYRASMAKRSEPYSEVYCNLYYFLALSEEMSATDKWPGFVLTKEGEDFVQQNASLFKYDLLYNPLRFESWQRLAKIYDEEVDLLLNDGSKHINVVGWRKNATLPQRVDRSRRRSRRCLLMSLGLANTSSQQCEIHELLALVYYDSLQNVVPFYDQQSILPSKDAAWVAFCENSMKHFKKAFSHKQDWSHAFYIGKLCEKLGYPYERSLSYYNNAISLNPSAADPVYRMHASRLKLLHKCGKQDLEALKVLSRHSFLQSTKDAVMSIFREIGSEIDDTIDQQVDDISEDRGHDKSNHLEDVWHILYHDCLSALENCIEGDLKHFHKARYMLAQGLYKRGVAGDLERAKDELSFCFKSSRSSFTINMWEIDGMVRKGRRRTPGVAGNKKVLEVNLPESSRKFITCIRKYLLFYLRLLEETGDTCTLERAFASLRADKRFSLCVEDLVPVALARLVKALVSSICEGENAKGSSEHQLEKVFSLFIEQGSLWPEILSLAVIQSPEFTDSSLYGYLHRYISSLEGNRKLETLEVINEKIRKRFKNPKLLNSNCARVCRHASVGWCRSLIIGLALITPLPCGMKHEIQADNAADDALVSSQSLYLDLQANELWNSSSDFTPPEDLERKWAPVLIKMKNLAVRKAEDKDFEAANSLLKSCYYLYRESSCGLLPSGINLYVAPSKVALDTKVQLGVDGVEVVDLSIPRKLLLWAYVLLHGRYASIGAVLKYCEENVKVRMYMMIRHSGSVLRWVVAVLLICHSTSYQ